MFQSTHPHGVRRCTDGDKFIVKCFNPRTHTGCDPSYLVAYGKDYRFNPRTHTGCDIVHGAFRMMSLVSIHAPTRGATSTKRKVDVLESVSIHAPTRGATSNMIDCAESFVFQSTHPHGVRRHLVSNPAGSTGVSIHAPTRGATSRCNCHFMPTKFQSTHPHGVRLINSPSSCGIDVSIHAPTRGATRIWMQDTSSI